MRKLSTLLMLVLVSTLTLKSVEFNKTAELTADVFSELRVDDDRQIFTISDRGLLKSTNMGETWISLANELTTSSVTDLEINSDGRLLVVNNNEVMTSMDDGFTWTTLSNGLNGSIVSDLELMTDGTIFAATNNGAFRLDESSMNWIKLNINGEGNGNNILAIGEDGEGNILLSGSNSGLSISTDGGLTFEAFDIGISIGGVLSTMSAIAIDDDGNLMLGSEDGELFLLDNTTLELTQILDASVINDEITDIELNNDFGTIISTKSRGLFSSTNNQDFTRLNGSGNLVSKLNITSEGDLLFLDENGLGIGEDGSSVSMLDINFDASSVLAFTSDGNNSIVITDNVTLSGSSNGFLKIGDGASGNMVVNDLMISNGVTIAATNQGVFTLDTETENWVEVVSSSETGIATEIELSTQGKILIGTENGVLISDDETFENSEIVDFTGLLDLDTEVTSIDVASNGQISVANNTLLYKSDDEGETFESVSLGLTLNLIGSLEWDANGNVYLGTNSNGLFKSDDNGLTFVKLDGVLDNENIISIETQGSKLYVQTENALMLSQDGGANFDNLTSNLNLSSITSFELTGNNSVELLAAEGIFRSDDGGLSFEEQVLNIDLGNMTDIASDSQGNFLLSTESNGLFTSEDNGMTWLNLSTTLENTNITSVEFDRNNDNTIFLGTDNGLMVSVDGGETFTQDGNTELNGQTITDLMFTSDDELMIKFGIDSRIGILSENGDLDILNVDGDNNGLLSADKMGSLLSISTEDGLFLSNDGGLNFNEVEGEGTSSEITGVIDFAFNSSNRLVLATDNMLLLRENEETTDVTGSLDLSNMSSLELFNDGRLTLLGDGEIFQSSDATLESFSNITGNLSGSQGGVLDFELMEDGELNILTENGLFAGNDDSQDRDRLNIDLMNVNFNELTIVSDSKILASTDGGLFESNNFGNSFERIMLEGRVVIDAAVNNSGEIFAATEEDGFLKLNNSGQILTDLSAQFNGETVENVESDGEKVIIASSNSVVKISNDGGLTFTNLDGNSSSMSEVIADAEGNLVVITNDGTALMLDATTKTLTELNFSGNGSEINGFGTDLTGDIFLSTESSGVFRSEDDGDTFISVNNGLTTNAIIDLTSSEVGNVYALTLDGVFQFDSETMNWVNVVGNAEGEFESATDLKAFTGPIVTTINGVGNPNNDVLVMSTAKGFYYTAPLSPATVGEVADRVINIYPNPSNNLNNLTLTMDNATKANLSVYNSNGQVMATVNNLSLNAGENKVNLNLTNVVAGNYFVELKLGNTLLTKQVVIVK